MSRAAVRGKRLNRVAQDWSNAMDGGVKTSDNKTDAAGREVPTYTRRFNDGVSAADEALQLKTKLITDKRTGATPFGVATFDEKDARLLLKKQAEAKEADFDGWFGENYHLADLPTRQLAAKLNPDYYASREREMVQRAKMALRIKLIDFRGPRDEEDLRIKYGLETGDIVLGEGWDRIGGDEEQTTSQGRNKLHRDMSLAARIFQRGQGPDAESRQKNRYNNTDDGGFAQDQLASFNNPRAMLAPWL